MIRAEALDQVAGYYEAQLRTHGASPRGTGWNGAEAQTLRFSQLAKLLPPHTPYSVTDLGCGYGALVGFLNERKHEFQYVGCDISAPMIDCARRHYAALANVTFAVSAAPSGSSDYCVASGIFNVPMAAGVAEWQAHVEATIALMHSIGQRGFAFNCLTTYSDAEKMSPSLYYGDPCYYFDLCKKKYSRDVALLHDYGLYDFTIIVRK